MNTEGTNSPWNVVPVSTSSETANTWAVSPFQTNDPIKLSDASSLPAESEPEPDVISSVVMENLPTKKKSASSALSSVNQENTLSSSAWITSPITRVEETVQTSARTSDATKQMQKVEEESAPTNFIENVSDTFVKDVALPIEQGFTDKVETEAVHKDSPQNMQLQVEENTMTTCITSAPSGEVPATACSALVEEDFIVVENVVVEKPAVQKQGIAGALGAQVVDGPDHPVVEEEPAEKNFITLVKEPAIVSNLEDVATLNTLNTSPVRHGERTSALTSAHMQQELSLQKAAGEHSSESLVEKGVTSKAVKPVGKVDANVEKVKSTVLQINTSTQKAPSASPWTTTPVQEDVINAAFAHEEPAQVAEKVHSAAKVSASIVKDHPVIEKLQIISACKSSPRVDIAETIEKTAAVVVKNIAIPVAKSIVALKEKESIALSSWNTAPVPEKATLSVDKVEKVAGPVKEFVAKPVLESDSVNQVDFTVKSEAITQKKVIPKAVKDVVAIEAVIAENKTDKNAIANTLEGVASYKADSIVLNKKAFCVETTIADSTKSPGNCGACGIASCSIM